MNELEKIIEQVIADELQGIDLGRILSQEDALNLFLEEGVPIEGLDAVRKVTPVFTRVAQRIMPKAIQPAVQRAAQKIAQASSVRETEAVFFYHGKLPASGTDLEYFSSKQAGERYNFKKDGIIPDRDIVLTGISAFITPPVTNPTDITNIISKLMKADVSLTVDNDEKLSVPLEYILDFSPIVDGSTTAIVYLRNSRLERGALPLSGITVKANKTVRVKIDFKDTFTNTTYWLFIGLHGKQMK
ncbi:MAG: hypothetical protein QXJ14_02790 [Candidatus Aenigmatarchaeota archaeon]